MIADLNEERQLGKALRKNQEKFQIRITELDNKYIEKEKEILELKDQLRDLMFYIDAQKVSLYYYEVLYLNCLYTNLL